MGRKTETKITQKIISWIKEQGGDAWHVHGSSVQRTGEPDIDGWLPGDLHLKLEVKTPSGKPSPIQLHRLCRYSGAHYVAGIVTSVEEVQELVELHKLGTKLIPKKFLVKWLSEEMKDVYSREIGHHESS